MHGVLFDFDGTLAHLNIDFGEMRQAVKRVGVRMGLPGSFLDHKFILEAIDEVVAEMRCTRPEAAEVFARATAEVIEEVEMRAAVQSHLLPGVEELFANLQARGIAVGIVTRNCRKAVEHIIGGALTPQTIRTREDVKKVKPDPSHLLLAAADLGLEAAEVWMVGDHPMDMVAATKAGMRSVGVLTGTSSADDLMQAGAWKVIASAANLLELLPAPI